MVRRVCEELVERVPSGLSLSGAREGVLLEGLGDRVGRLVYPGSVGQQLLEMVGGLGTARSLTLSVAVDSGLGEVAVEAARLPDGMVPARHPGVRMNRLIPGPVVMPVPSPGPLKILVAVGTPDRGADPECGVGSGGGDRRDPGRGGRNGGGGSGGGGGVGGRQRDDDECGVAEGGDAGRIPCVAFVGAWVGDVDRTRNRRRCSVANNGG